jgi:hypothetical protein
MRLKKGDPIPSDNTRTSSIDPRMLQALIDAQDAIDLSAIEDRQAFEGPLGMYEADPAGLPTQDPVFDLLTLAGPKAIASLGKKAIGETGESIAKNIASKTAANAKEAVNPKLPGMLPEVLDAVRLKRIEAVREKLDDVERMVALTGRDPSVSPYAKRLANQIDEMLSSVPSGAKTPEISSRIKSFDEVAPSLGSKEALDKLYYKKGGLKDWQWSENLFGPMFSKGVGLQRFSTERSLVPQLEQAIRANRAKRLK